MAGLSVPIRTLHQSNGREIALPAMSSLMTAIGHFVCVALYVPMWGGLGLQRSESCPEWGGDRCWE